MLNKTFLFLLIYGLSFTAKAQDFVDNEQQYVEDFVLAVNELVLDNKTGLTIAEASTALKEASKPVALHLHKAARKKRTAKEIYANTKAATVVMGSAYLCPHCSHTHIGPASGYIIDPKGIVVTNYHVAKIYVDMAKENTPLGFFARLADGRTYAVKKILAASEKDDLAIVQLDTDETDLPTLTLGDKADVGDDVFVLGHPKGMYYFFSKGMVMHKYIDKMIDRPGTTPRETMVISADYAVGSSGGPVVDAYGNVVGTVSNTRTLSISQDNPTVQIIIKNTIPVESLWKLIQKN